MFVFKVRTGIPDLWLLAVGDVEEGVEEVDNWGVDPDVGFQEPGIVILALDPLGEQRAKRREFVLVAAGRELTVRSDDIADFRPDLADVEPGMRRAIASVDRKQSIILLSLREVCGFRPARDAIATLLANGVHEVIEPLHVTTFGEILDLRFAHRIALTVQAGVVLELRLACGRCHVVDRPAVGEFTRRARCFQATRRAQPAGPYNLLAADVPAERDLVGVAGILTGVRWSGLEEMQQQQQQQQQRGGRRRRRRRGREHFFGGLEWRWDSTGETSFYGMKLGAFIECWFPEVNRIDEYNRPTKIKFN